MKYGKSMYLGGSIIDSANSNHESCRKLGIICPFCAEAVFFRQGSTHFRQEKRVIIPNSFSHYPNVESTDCELKSIRRDGLEYIESLEIESKNQRLRLYNNHLWDIFKALGPNKYDIKRIKTLFGHKWLEENAIKSHKEMMNNLKRYQEQSKEFWINSFSNERIKILKLQFPELTDIELKDKQMIVEYLSTDFQINTAYEVIAFLASKTGLFVYKKTFAIALYEECVNEQSNRTQTVPDQNNKALEMYHNVVKKNYNQERTGLLSALFVYTIDWAKMFEVTNNK